MAAKWSAFVSGAVLTAAQLNDVVDNFQDIAIFNETQANNTSGGTFTSGSYTKRVLNTTVVNNITGCSISSSVITLPAGTFAVRASAPAFAVIAHKARIQNTTAGTTLALGQNQYANTSATAQTSCEVLTIFTLSVSSTIELQHRCESTRATTGFGVSCVFGDSEIYSQIMIQRIA
jgi:hypothetical protein